MGSRAWWRAGGQCRVGVYPPPGTLPEGGVWTSFWGSVHLFQALAHFFNRGCRWSRKDSERGRLNLTGKGEFGPVFNGSMGSCRQDQTGGTRCHIIHITVTASPRESAQLRLNVSLSSARTSGWPLFLHRQRVEADKSDRTDPQEAPSIRLFCFAPHSTSRLSNDDTAPAPTAQGFPGTRQTFRRTRTG